MPITGLANATLRVSDLEQALAFHVDVLGLVELARDDSGVFLSCGADGQCDLVLTEGGTGVADFTFQVTDEEDLAYYSERLRRENIEVSEISDAKPGQTKAIRFTLPSGHVMELGLIAPVVAQQFGYPHPAVPASRRLNGISPLDLDHITLRAEDVERLATFLSGVLGFHITDARRESTGRWRGAWTHISDQHHDLAIIRGRAGETLDHLAWTVNGIEHMKSAGDLLAQVGIPIEVGPGRHSIGGNLFTYFWAPGGNRYELSAEMARIRNPKAETSFWGDAPGLFSPWGIVPPESFARGS